MRPAVWHPPVALSGVEQAIVQRIRRAKLFVFLREWRHQVFDEVYQQELAEALYQDRTHGQPPLPAAQLALATLMQAYTGASDDEVIEAATMDRRWQLVLACLDCDEPPFSKGTLVAFRQRLIVSGQDRRLLERTVEVAEQTGGFGPRALRAALDSSPLWGASRVEDTYNLVGHALCKALGVLARQQGRGLAEVAAEAGATVLGGPSLKAALDRDWDDPEQRQQALETVLAALEAVEGWVAGQPAGPEDPTVRQSLACARQVQGQDVEPDAAGRPRLRRGVARQRRIAVEDAQMRHGRKSHSVRVDGYKRHVVHDLDSGAIRAVGLTPANAPEASVTEALSVDLAAQHVTVAAWYLDRGYLASTLVRDRTPDQQIYCKAWPVRNGDRFPKTAFMLDWERQVLRCPNAVEMPFVPGGVVHFPAATCAACPLRARCTSSAHGRSVSIHPDERLLAELRQRQLTPLGRAQLRQRVAVEHDLAHIGHWQRRRARYRGVRKNLFDLRRCAAVHNLHLAARYTPAAEAA